ncbi:MAG: hypothetical protein OIF56_05815 [Cohaesibacter sp.]|nr:hypothetical protein [Cohaesibacter sp.]MCV6602437.1 hypothetical protein [Cohaesibacter sp.]
MLPAIVLIAEALVVLWFVLFLTLITSGYLEGRSYGISKKTKMELAFLKHVRHFVIVGVSLVMLLSITEITGLTNLQ